MNSFTGFFLLRFLGAILISVIFLWPVHANIISATIKSRPITHFKIGSDDTKFGSFEFIGGFEIISNNKFVGGISGFHYLDNRTDFIGISDTGFWFKGILKLIM